MMLYWQLLMTRRHVYTESFQMKMNRCSNIVLFPIHLCGHFGPFTQNFHPKISLEPLGPYQKHNLDYFLNVVCTIRTIVAGGLFCMQMRLNRIYSVEELYYFLF